MKNRIKYIYDFLSNEDRKKYHNDLAALKNETNYIEIDNADSMIRALWYHEHNQEPKLIQIIAHGNNEGFGISDIEFVKYNEIVECLKSINSSSNNELILNLMTVCKSVHQLNTFNLGTKKMYKNFIGSIGEAPIQSALKHSIEVNNLELDKVKDKIEEINFNINDKYLSNNIETFTYLLT